MYTDMVVPWGAERGNTLPLNEIESWKIGTFERRIDKLALEVNSSIFTHFIYTPKYLPKN